MQDLHVPGAKDDAEKIDWTYLSEYFPNAVRALGRSKQRPIGLDSLELVSGGDTIGAAVATALLIGKPSAQIGAGSFSTGVLRYAGALEQVCIVSMAGAKKYTRGGWRTVENGKQRYLAAWWRHWIDRNVMGETHSQDLGILHLAHELWNLMAVIELDTPPQLQ
jgi:hypothetical protein